MDIYTCPYCGWQMQMQAHHPDCQCDACTYGADLAKWVNHAGEY